MPYNEKSNYGKKNLRNRGITGYQRQQIIISIQQKQKSLYLPGGKIEQGEDTLMALQREILEELNVVLVPERITYYCHITAPAYGEKDNIIMEQDCFLYELKEDIHPNNEIEEIKYFDYNMYMAEEKQVIGVLKVMEQLTEDGILVY